MTLQFHFLGIVVADMAASLTFYRRLGFDIPAEMDKEPHVEFQLPGGPLVAWDTVTTIKSFNPDWAAPQGDSRIDLAFRCESPAEVDRVYGELTSAGYEGSMEPWDAFWGQRYAVVHDPDGNGVDLFCPLKGD
jgi:catechol 2,3-dioxygenase-like lactoylglutathione lyase family enzyme